MINSITTTWWTAVNDRMVTKYNATHLWYLHLRDFLPEPRIARCPWGYMYSTYVRSISCIRCCTECRVTLFFVAERWGWRTDQLKWLQAASLANSGRSFTSKVFEVRHPFAKDSPNSFYLEPLHR